MKKFMKTILSGVQAWTRGEIRNSTADWSQNDPNADSYVKNRTHWEEEGNLILVNNLTSEDENWPRCDFIPGQRYTVIWNGVEYKDQLCINYDGFDFLGDPEEDLPFYIDDDGGNSLYVWTEDSNWTLTITTVGTIVHKIPGKFIDLPRNLATTDQIENLWDYAGDAYSRANEAYTKAENAQTAADGAQSTADNALETANKKMNKANPEGTGKISVGTSNISIGSNSQTFGVGLKNYGNSSSTIGKYNISELYTLRYSHSSGNIGYLKSRSVIYSTNLKTDPMQKTFSLESPSSDRFDTMISKLNTNRWESLYFTTASSGENLTSVTHITYDYRRGTGTQNGEPAIFLQEYDTCAMISISSSIDSEYAHIIGNGTSDTERSNAHTLDWEGNAWYSGDVYVGSTSGTNKDEGSKKLATEEYVDELVAASIENNEQVQVDWNQNDETAPDYIKNRPFYTQNGRVALVDNLTRENYENGIHPVCNFVPGQSYDVVWDGVLYENIICIDDDGWNVILGDMFYIDDDGGNGLYIEGFEEDWSTLSIFTTQELIKKIDEKYLPNVRKVLKLYTCYSENADDGQAEGTPALAPDKILRVGFADWEDYVTVEALANADDIVIFEGQTKVGVPANITFCTHFDDYYNTSTEYAIITFYSEHEGRIRTMWSRESGLVEYLATQGYVDAEISKISAISLTEDLTDSEKKEVRDNIGAGTSNFSGSYNDLTDKPDLGQLDLITPEDIDVICGQSIELASEVLL